MDDRTRWNERYRAGEGPTRVNARLSDHLYLLKRGRALDLGCGIGQNGALLREWDVVLVDLAEEALARATGACVQANGLALPFPPSTFDTIVNTYYFEPELDLAALLVPSGTLYFETFTLGDSKYRPEFRHAPRLDLTRVADIFRGLELILVNEVDDGERVFATVIGRRPTGSRLDPSS